MSLKLSNFTADTLNKKMTVSREFAAPLEKIWEAWTDPKILDQWWAPKPWKARTKSMDFREGGMWLYCMEGPDGTKSWARADYKKISTYKSYTGEDAFCDENGVINEDFPRMLWKVDFRQLSNKTKVDVEITFSKEEDLKKIMEMGFEEGFNLAHENLDELILTGKL